LSVRTYIGRGLVTAAVVVASTVGAAGVAHAAAPTVDIQAGRLVLEPGARGYHGSLPVAVTYRGDHPDYANLRIVEPVAGAFTGMTPSDACMINPPEAAGAGRVLLCGVPGGDLQPGQRRRFTLDFEVLTTPRAYAMSAAATSVEVALGSTPDVTASATAATLFRSTTGSVRNPQPYVQDTRTDISVSAQDTTLVRQEDGSYAGRVPVTVHFAGDAPHFELGAEITLSDGVEFHGVDPEEACGLLSCPVPGGKFMAGETRTFHLLVSAPAALAGSGTVTISNSWYNDVEDVDPADNTAAFTLTAG
jgi:hypothetical protein